MAIPLPVINLQGTNYEVGKATGEAFSYAIQSSLYKLWTLSEIFIPFYETAEGRVIVERYLNKAKEHYPQYVSELRGIADGADVDFIKLFLLHIETELSQNTESTCPVSIEGCTDVYLNTTNAAILAHNEDTPPNIRDDMYVIRVHILPTEENRYKEEKFTALAYPGGLPGNTCAFNHHGVAFTCNHLFQQKTNLEGIPRRFVARAVLSAKSIHEVEGILGVYPGIGTGMNFNLAELSGFDSITNQRICRMTNIEVAGGDCVTLTDCMDITGFYHHFNDYLRLDGEFLCDTSSDAREKRLTELQHAKLTENLSDVKDIMGDTYNVQYPLFRNGKKPDYLATACTSIFDYKRMTAEFYRGNPKSTKPFATFSLDYKEC